MRHAPPTPEESTDPARTPVLSAAAVAVVLYAVSCKMLLFRNAEYTGSDLYSFLDMSRSWWFAGRLLYENAFGDHTAIHNYYLLLAFSPLTIPLGAYGLFAGLGCLELLAVVRVARSAALDLVARIAVLSALLSPIAFYAFDDPLWGFHLELCYLPLATLFALDLVEGRSVRAILTAAAIVLVKEDGALLCAAVLVAYFTGRLWALRQGSSDERRRTVKAALASLFVTSLVFAAGLAILWVLGRGAPEGHATASGRIGRAIAILARTLSGQGAPARRIALAEGLASYAACSLLLLLPLAKRLPRGLALFALSLPCVLASLVVSTALYKFSFMFWPPRIAMLAALVVACVVFSASGAASRPAWSPAAVTALALLSWGSQLYVLRSVDYRLGERLDAAALWSERNYTLATMSQREIDFYRCVAGRLPPGTPVSPLPRAYPMFHHQSIVFQGLDANAWRLPRLRMVPASKAGDTNGGLCRGPRTDAVLIEADCELLPRLAGCG